MPLEMLLALVLILPIVLMFAVFIWYLNVGGVCAALRDTRRKRQAVNDSKKMETGQP